MPKPNTSEADSNNVSPEAQPKNAKASTTPNTGTGRFHVVRGISYPVIRSYYDGNQDAVIDVVEVTKTTPRKNGTIRTTTVLRHVYCKDAALQAKYSRKKAAVEVAQVIADVE